MIAEKSSVEEESMGNNGRLLRVASASVKTVASSLNVRREPLTIFTV